MESKCDMEIGVTVGGAGPNFGKTMEDVFKAKTKAERQAYILKEQLDMAKEQLGRNASAMKKTESDNRDREQIMLRLRQAMHNEANMRRQLMEANKKLERKEEREQIDHKRWADKEEELRDRHSRDMAMLRQEMDDKVRMVEEASKEDQQLAMYGKEVEMEQMDREYRNVMGDLKARIVGLERERERLKQALEQAKSKINAANTLQYHSDQNQSLNQPLGGTRHSKQLKSIFTPRTLKPSIKQVNTCPEYESGNGSPTPIPISRRVVDYSASISCSEGGDGVGVGVRPLQPGKRTFASAATASTGKKKRVRFAPDLLQVVRASPPSAKLTPKSTSDVFFGSNKKPFVSRSSSSSSITASAKKVLGESLHPAFHKPPPTLGQSQSLMNQLRSTGPKHKLYTSDKLLGEDF